MKELVVKFSKQEMGFFHDAYHAMHPQQDSCPSESQLREFLVKMISAHMEVCDCVLDAWLARLQMLQTMQGPSRS